MSPTLGVKLLFSYPSALTCFGFSKEPTTYDFFYFAASSEGLSGATTFIMLTFLLMFRVLNSLLPTINVLKLTKFPSFENLHLVSSFYCPRPGPRL